MTKLGEMLANNGRKNKVFFLKRERAIRKLANGGDRSMALHYASIGTLDEMSVEGDIVLLMDDVTTTGNSLYACKGILISKGAEHVEMFALGKSI